MRRRKRRGAGNDLGVDRRAQRLRQLDELGVGAAVRDGVAGDDQRTLRLRQHRGGFRDRCRIAAQPRRHARRRRQVDLALGLEDVAGQRQEHRAGRRRQRRLRRAMHEPRQVGEPLHLGGPFHQRPRQCRQVGPQDRLGGVEIEVVLAGGDEDRAPRLLRVVEHAHGVAEPGRDVQVDDREPAGRLRIAVGHADDDRLLQGEHVAQVVLGRERVHQRQFGGARIAEDDVDALLLEQLQEGTLSGHEGHYCLLRSSLRGRDFRPRTGIRNHEALSSSRRVSDGRMRLTPSTASMGNDWQFA